MSLSDEESDPSIEIYGSDAEANESEEPEEEEYEEVEVEEEVEEEEVDEEEGEEEEVEEEEGEEEGVDEEEVEEEEVEEEEGEEEKEEEEEVEEEEEEEGEEDEEEEEDEEGEDEEEKEGDEEKAEDNLKVSEPPGGADKDPPDSSQHMEFEGQERNLRLISPVAENPSTVSVEKNDSSKILTTEKEDSFLKNVTSSSSDSRNIVAISEDDKHQRLDVDIEHNGSLLLSKNLVGSTEQNSDSKAYLGGVENMDSGTAKSSSAIGEDMAADIQQREGFLEDANVDTQNSVNQIKQLEMQSGDEMKQIASRCTSPGTRTRNVSPSAEIQDGNKRPAIICSFFAKGWCIRGTSCRFLHIKDRENNAGQLAEGDQVNSNWKREVQLEEGLRDNAEASKENVQDEQEANPRLHPPQDKQKFPLHPKEDLSSNLTSRTSLLPDNRSMFNASSDYFSMSLSSYPPSVEGLATIPSHHRMYNRYSSSIMSHSPNSGPVTHLPNTSMPLSHQISAPSGYSLSFNSSIGASTSDAQKLLNSGKEYHPPRSALSGSEQEELPLISSSAVLPFATRYKTKIPSYDWEPSVPFRPSFFITPTNMSSPGDLYDPFHPSVEIPNIGDGSLKASFFIDGPSVYTSSQVQTYGECAVEGDTVADINEEKSSVSSHNRIYENKQNKNCVPCEKDFLAPETETTARTYLNSQNDETGVGENTLHIEDITKTGKEQSEYDGRYQVEGLEHKRRRVERAKKNDEMCVDSQMDEVQNDMKGLKTFRAALVDLVKELLKPSWHDGRLSKDAHNTIVKKSVDKVISTLQPHQVPATPNMVIHYVSSSRLKIAKLVDAYVNKYGKS